MNNRICTVRNAIRHGRAGVRVWTVMAGTLGLLAACATPVEPWVDQAKALGLDQVEIGALGSAGFLETGRGYSQAYVPYVRSKIPIFITSYSVLAAHSALVRQSEAVLYRAAGERLKEVLALLSASVKDVLRKPQWSSETWMEAEREVHLALAVAIRILDAGKEVGDADLDHEIRATIEWLNHGEGGTPPLFKGLPESKQDHLRRNFRDCFDDSLRTSIIEGARKASNYQKANPGLDWSARRLGQEDRAGKAFLQALTVLESSFFPSSDPVHGCALDLLDSCMRMADGEENRPEVSQAMDLVRWSFWYRRGHGSEAEEEERDWSRAREHHDMRRLLGFRSDIGIRFLLGFDSRSPEPAPGKIQTPVLIRLVSHSPVGALKMSRNLLLDLVDERDGASAAWGDRSVRLPVPEEYGPRPQQLYGWMLASLLQDLPADVPPQFRTEAWRQNQVESVVCSIVMTQQSASAPRLIENVDRPQFVFPQTGFIEPASVFYWRMAVLAENSIRHLEGPFRWLNEERNGYISDTSALLGRWRRFRRTCQNLVFLSQKQCRGLDWTEPERAWVASYQLSLADAWGMSDWREEEWGLDYVPADDAFSVIRWPGSVGEAGWAAVPRPAQLLVLYPWKGQRVLCQGASLKCFRISGASRRMSNAEWRGLYDHESSLSR